MKKITLILLAFFTINCGAVFAQSYDTVSGATQKADGKSMNLDQFKKALEITGRKLIFSTVNADGTPNAAAFASFQNIEDNVFAVTSMDDSKTTKINVKRTKQAILIMVLNEKNEDGFDGAKVVLKYVGDSEKVSKYRSQMEKSSEKTTFFTVEKFLAYR